MAEAGERVFLAENAVTVTNTRFVVGSQVFTMSGLSSVTFSSIKPSRWAPILLMVIGLPLVAINIHNWQSAIPVVGGALWLAIQRTQYSVLLSSASGQTKALSSTDKDYINRVVDALNSSIIARG